MAGAGEQAGTLTPNDPLDADSRPNGLQNAPVITTVTRLPEQGGLRVEGVLHSKPSTSYLIQAMEHEDAPAPFGQGGGSGDGARYLGSSTVTTDSEGNAGISFKVPGGRPGWLVALTATSREGGVAGPLESTSDYSAVVAPTDGPPAYPLLEEQTMVSLPEAESENGQFFSIKRPAGIVGEFDVEISLGSGGGPAPHPDPAYKAMKYRLSPEDPWTAISRFPEFGTRHLIPFSEEAGSRSVELAAFDDDSWDPDAKTGAILISYRGLDVNVPYVSVPVTFPDNESPPRFTLVSSSEIFTEGQTGPLRSYKMVADKPVSAMIRGKVTYDGSLSSVSPVEDLVDFSDRDHSLFYPPYSTGELFYESFAARDDLLVEGTETLVYQMVFGAEGYPQVHSTMTLNLEDDDTRQLSVSGGRVGEAINGNTQLQFLVSIPDATDRDISFQWAVTGGTAQAGSDFTAPNEIPTWPTATIPAGSVSTTFSIPVLGDQVIERDETVVVTLFPLGAGTPINHTIKGTGTILGGGFPTVMVDGASFTEEAGLRTLTGRLSAPAGYDLTLPFTLEGVSAEQGSDFHLEGSPSGANALGSFHFPAGSVSSQAQPRLVIVNDKVNEGAETFLLRWVPSPEVIFAGESVEYTIQASDMPMLSHGSVTVTEGDSGVQELVINFQLNAAASLPSSVEWNLTSDSAQVTPVGGSLNFDVGSRTAALTFSLAGDLIPETERPIRLLLSNAQNLYFAASTITVGTVLDNDQRTIAAENVTLPEGTGGTNTAAFRLRINSPLAVPVSAFYTTQPGTASAGSDFTSVSGTATIAAGETEVVIPVSIVGDTEFEEDESFTLRLSNPVNATLAATVLTGTITNDDAQPALSVSRSTVTTATEGGPFRAWISTSLASAPSVAASYRVTTRDDTAIAGVHYTAVNGGVLTFRPGGPEGPSWIALTVPHGGDETSRRFFVDFTPVSGPANTVTAEVSIVPLRILDFKPLLLGLHTVRFPTGVGQNYVIQEAESLAGPWRDNSSILTGSGSPVLQVVSSENEQGLLRPRAFFRVRAFTNPPATPVSLAP